MPVRTLLALTVLALALLAAAAPAGAAGRDCGWLQVGPGGKVMASKGPGAACLLFAYRGCRAAAYRLTVAPLDTIRTLTVRVVKRAHGCAVRYAASFRVVPQPAHSSSGGCRAIVRRAGAIVAVGCGASGDLRLSA